MSGWIDAGRGYNAAENAVNTASMRKKWRDGFPGSSLDATRWGSSAGTGGSLAVSGGVFTLSSGTTANDTVYAITKEVFMAPTRVAFGLTLSQRIANQTFFVELVSVDPLTQQPDGLNSVAWLFDGTTATQGKYRTQVAGNTAIDSAASTVPTTASAGVYEIELYSDDTWFHGGTLDSSVIRANSYRRHTGTPDPNALYKLRLRWLNGGSAPASSTNAAVSYLIVQDHEVLTAEITGGRGQTAVGQALGVTINSGTVTSVTSASLGTPGPIADVASAALTTTTTTTSITPTYGCSYEVNIPVTAVSGTNPTLDVTVQESDDSGTNWFDIYYFPRITATGMYRSPKLPLTGNRVRYVQTVSGTSPSFTRAVNRLQSSDSTTPKRQLIDRSISLTTLSSATPSINTQGCDTAQIVVNIGTATTAPILQLQGSDDNGATWYSIGSTLTAVASSTVQLTTANIQAGLIRATVSSAGNTVVAGYVMVKGF